MSDSLALPYNNRTILDSSDEDPIVDLFRQHVEQAHFPCTGAKASLHRSELKFIRARSIISAWDDVAIHNHILKFAKDYDPPNHDFRSLAILFSAPTVLTEEEFENHFWERLQSWTDKDEWLGQNHDKAVSKQPKNKDFALSFGGRAFFAVGLHPNASREARRFEYPAIVLNLHDQFEKLRSDSRYEKLHKKILERDEALQGSTNPMLAHHGEISAARQYSGRMVDENWEAPYHRKIVKSQIPEI